MSDDDRHDLKQVEAFRALARRIGDAQSYLRFEDALRRLMTPAPQPETAALNGEDQPPIPLKRRHDAVKA
jgi:hypothetical protein